MSNPKFSDEEMAFFSEGETLSDTRAPTEDFDFSDLDDASEESPNGWARTARAVLALVAPARSS